MQNPIGFIQLSETSSAHCIAHLSLQAKSLSVPISSSFVRLLLPPPLSLQPSPHCCWCLCGMYICFLANHLRLLSCFSARTYLPQVWDHNTSRYGVLLPGLQPGGAALPGRGLERGQSSPGWAMSCPVVVREDQPVYAITPERAQAGREVFQHCRADCRCGLNSHRSDRTIAPLQVPRK